MNLGDKWGSCVASTTHIKYPSRHVVLSRRVPCHAFAMILVHGQGSRVVFACNGWYLKRCGRSICFFRTICRESVGIMLGDVGRKYAGVIGEVPRCFMSL